MARLVLGGERCRRPLCVCVCVCVCDGRVMASAAGKHVVYFFMTHRIVVHRSVMCPFVSCLAFKD